MAKKKNNFEDDEEQKLSVRENDWDFEDKNNDEEESENEDSEENEDEETTEELEEIVSRTPAPRRAIQRQTANSSLEISEQPELESQVQDTPTQTRTETDNATKYVTNAPSYSASTTYETARGDYNEAGYPKQMQIRDPRIEQPTPFITPTPFDTSQIRQPIIKPWFDPTQTQVPSPREIEEKKYEPMGERKRRRIL